METNKIKISALLLLFMIAMVGARDVEIMKKGKTKICPQNCVPKLAFMICNGGKSQHPKCINCCKAGRGCILFFNDGTSQTC